MKQKLFLILSIVHLFLGIAIFPSAGLAQQSEPFLVSNTPSVTEMKGRVSYLLDPDRTLTISDIASPEGAAGFTPIETRSADFGYTKSNIWLRFSVRTTQDSGPQWRLHFRENFLQILEVYQRQADGTLALLEAHTEDTAFRQRRVIYPEVVVAFEQAAGEESEFFLKYRSGGSSQLSFTVRSLAEFDQLAARKTAKNFIYYGMLLFLILIAAAAFVATRQVIFVSYFVYAGFGLLFIMHGDGNTFQYLWPNAPVFNGYASVLLGAGIISTGAFFARLFLNTSFYHPILDKVMLAILCVALLMVAATTVFDTQIIKKYLVLLSLIGTLSFTISGLVAARKRFKEVRFFVIAWTGAVISSGIMASRHLLGIEISEEVQFDSMRIVFVLDAALMGAAIVDRINQLRQEQRAALQANLTAAERSLALTGRFQELELQYALAVELADRNERRLTDTVHDLRQPLHALRLNVQGLIRSKGTGQMDPAQIEDTFGYLEDLVSKELQPLEHDRNQKDENALDGGSVELGEVMRNTYEMFVQDATDKGLVLRYVPSSLVVDLAPLDVMRIATNLVSNAVKYTNEGRVLFGTRRRNGAIWFEVHDTGIGMSKAEFEQVQVRAARGEALKNSVEGYGLGLAIVNDIATKERLEVVCEKRVSGGTTVRVRLTSHQALSVFERKVAAERP